MGRVVKHLILGGVMVAGLASAVSGQDMTTQLSLFLTSLRAGYLAVNNSTGNVTMSADVYRADNTAWRLGAGGVRVASNALVSFSSTTDPNGSLDTGITRNSAGVVEVNNGSAGTGGRFVPGTTTFASLGTPSNGQLVYCSDCTIANPCASGGTGALAKRLNSVWVCN